MSGGSGVHADPSALASFAAAGASIVGGFEPAVRSVRSIQAQVQAGCGGRGVSGEGLELLDQLLGEIAETSAGAAEVRRDLLDADSPLGVVSPTGGHSLGPVIVPGLAKSSGGSIPWLDPNTDSWVVGLLRAGTTGVPSQTLLERLRSDVPSVVSELTDTEMSSANQVRLLVNDRQRFLDNWLRAGQGTVSGVTSLGVGAGGFIAALVPGLDDSVDAVLGRRPGEDLRAGVATALHDLVVDPDSLASSAVGWDQYRDDPYRWFGEMVPEAVLEATTAALPLTVARRTVAVSDLGGDFAGARVLRPDASVSGPFPDLDEIRRVEADWGPTDPITSSRVGPFENPETWVEEINGAGPSMPGRRYNCIDCARAVEANWRGDDAVAAPLADPDVYGVAAERLETWSGGEFRLATIHDIENRLLELGPGSSALITSAWDTGGAHAYNAVNHAGTVRWIDGQLGRSSEWPPSYADHVDESIVIYIDPDGTPERVPERLAEEGLPR